MSDFIVATEETRSVLFAIANERDAQDRKWGPQNHDDGTGPDARIMGYSFASYARIIKGINDREYEYDMKTGALVPAITRWSPVLLEEVYEALETDNDADLRAELVQVAAVAVAWIEAIDRRTKT